MAQSKPTRFLNQQGELICEAEMNEYPEKVQMDYEGDRLHFVAGKSNQGEIAYILEYIETLH